ncbi:MAG: tetratricopeptide (TPR) repeat protein, partial [Saprospiraceae bacterium]
MAHPKWLLIVFLFLIFTLDGFGQDEVVVDTVVYTMADTMEAKRLIIEADKFNKSKKHDIALNKLDSAAQIYLLTVGKESSGYGHVLHMFGLVYQEQNQLDTAIVFYQSAITIWEKIHGPKHLKIAVSLNNLGNCYRDKADYEKAIDLHQKALKIRIDSLGNEALILTESYTNLGNCFYTKGDYDNAISYYRKTLQLQLKLLNNNNISIAKTYNGMGSILAEKGDFDKAMFYCLKALPIYLESSDDTNIETGALYNNIGTIYSDKGDYTKAIEFHQKALDTWIKLLDINHPYVAISYNNIGTCFMAKGDYEKAIDCYQKTLIIWLKTYGSEHPYVASAYNNIGICYLSKEDPKSSKEFHQKALDIRLKILGGEHPKVASSYSNIGNSLFNEGNYKQAIELHEKALKIRLKALGEEHPEVSDSYNNIGLSFAQLGDFRKAQELYTKSLEIKLKMLGTIHPGVASLYNDLGDLYSKLNNPEKAIDYFSKAKLANNYQKDNFKNVLLIQHLIKSLEKTGLAHLAVYQKNQTYSVLNNARQSFLNSIAAINYQSTTFSPSIKTSLADKANEILYNSIKTNDLLYQMVDSIHYLIESFSLTERSKGILLYEAMRESEALKITGIPDSLLEKEYELRINITLYDKKRQEKSSFQFNDEDSTSLKIGSKLFDLNREYESLKQHLETNYPKYYKAKYDLSTISLKEVQNNLLLPNQSLLEYMVGDSSIFIFLVQKDTFEIHEVKHDFPLNDWVQEMTKDGISGYYSIPQNKRNPALEENTISNYTNAAQQLYNKLIAPVADKLTEDLIIIPDGILGYVPFEALLTSAPPREGAFRAYPFLLKKHQISYCYSATLLQEMRQKQHRKKPTDQLLAMAPFFQNDVDELIAKIDTTDLLASVSLRDSLGALQGSGEEIARINKLWEGTSVYGTDASLAAFQQQAADYQILHLSTHGKADDRVGDYAYLAFGVTDEKGTFDKLYARDLYNYSLNADMVVLSACETGIGKLQKGEGIVSLARAFAYAGAKSIFNTLWKVDDVKTKD